MRTRRWFLRSLLISCLLSVVLACASAPAPARSDIPAFRFRGFGDRSSSLYLSLQAAEQIDDLFSRLALYNRVAEAYSLAGYWEESLAVLEHLERTAEALGSAEARADIKIEMARRYIANDEIETANDLLESALRLAGELNSDWNRGVIIERVIDASFEAGEDSFAVLQSAVNRTLVIDDLWTRVSILTNTARRYQRAGLGQSVNAMVQQALPAAGSLENPWQRALAFTEIALISRSGGGGERNAGSNVRRAIAELEAVEVLALSEDDARLLLRVASNLSELERHDEAVAALRQIPFNHLHARGLAEVGSAYARQGSRSSAFVLFSQAVREGEQSADAFRRAEVYAEVARRYLEIGEGQLAALNADFARTTAAELEDEYQKAAVFEQIIRVYIAESEIELVSELGEQLSDPFLRAGMLIAIAQQLYTANLRAEAVDTLERALAAAEESEFLRDTLLRRVATAFGEMEQLERGFEIVEQLESAHDIARALADLGAIAAGSRDGRLPRDTESLRRIEARISEL